ncbi:hypothetical protein KIN20_023940 [Parelaphostrongylus tenuis]|uniref:GPI ethanolamine phosphate transferase 1 n=1 Tax=Parelaphostrongylus tenuis TaxID=148309 RepID=A0AAD5N7P8_PARTN|nr:hypothetical protein KIN20_023940 [Parelaphostrongylus tenuis]
MEWRFALAGVLVHAVLIYSIFDIYYTSPVISNVPAHEITTRNAPAKTASRHSQLGVHGTSRSHVPTESRPGHVAIFAGFTEDVSAVARGWKYNPVKFDSIFNRSDEALAMGEHIKLDEWVFDQVEDFFESAKQNSSLMSSLLSNKRVFFLHLLGLDTNGHGNKPHSHQYLHNIEVVDRGIERMQRVFDTFFDDQSTAWVFTSDHGMTDWGSHGAGSDHEVLTPFVAWGAGIRKGGSSVTINQIDLTTLFASLIGVPIPVNSLGILPLQVFRCLTSISLQKQFCQFFAAQRTVHGT